MPLLKAVVTRRIALGLYNEHVLPLGPLALPDAMALLVQRLRCRSDRPMVGA
ncbi:MAG TPA: hypothetical protein VET87_00125 [Rubrivivax sp.]|nr:hypothetical protein [Rubrivivax sp.]